MRLNEELAFIFDRPDLFDQLAYREALEILPRHLGPGGERAVIEECLLRITLQAGVLHGVAFDSFKKPKKSGGYRLILVPVEILMELLRLVKSELLDRCPLGHSPHGFRKRRSSVTNARLHLEHGARYALNVDIKDCFPSTPIHRLHNVLDEAIGKNMRDEGVPLLVARYVIDILSTLMTFRYGRVQAPSLPIGTPTSPSAINLVLRPFDARLLRKLKQVTEQTTQEFTYTRYGDDMTVSSPDPLPRVLLTIISDMLHNFGYRPNTKKTKWMELHGGGPPIEVTGIIVSSDRLLLSDEWIQETERLLTNFVYHPQTDAKHREKTARRIRGKLSLCRMIYDGQFPVRIAHCISSLNSDVRPFVKAALEELSRTKKQTAQQTDAELADAEGQLADEDYVSLDDLDPTGQGGFDDNFELIPY